jgi:hypothetical protein
MGPWAGAPGLWRFTGTVHRCIKRQSSVSRSPAEIKWAKGYPPLLIVAADGGSAGSQLTPLTGAVARAERGDTGTISPQLG